MNHTLLSIIYFIAFNHAVMLCASLLLKSHTGSPAKTLAVVIALLAYKLFEGGALYSGLYVFTPHLLDLAPAVVMLLGPIFYGYTRAVAGQGRFNATQWLLHLAPWIAVWILLNSPAVFRTAELKIAMWDNVLAATQHNQLLPTEIVLRLLAIKVHLATYLYLSFHLLRKFSNSTKHLRSDNTSVVLQQLSYLTLSFIALEALWVSLFIAQQYFSFGTLGQVSQIWLLFIALIVLAIGFIALQKPDLVFSQEESRIVCDDALCNQHQTTNSKVKYIHSALDNTAATDIAHQIEHYFDTQQAYLNDKLTLADLAKALNLKGHMLSQVINQHMKSNFYKLVNSYRVQHAVNLLDDTNLNWSIERIALESGFSNRVTFNNAFKEHMSCTASNYKKQQSAAG